MLYHFDDCELEDRLYQLRRQGELVEIEPKAFDLLVYLLYQRERVVTKDELLEKLWPEMMVSEAALTRCVARAREAVGDDGDKQRIIKTQHGRGYRFVAPLTLAPPVVRSPQEGVRSQQEEKQQAKDREAEGLRL